MTFFAEMLPLKKVPRQSLTTSFRESNPGDTASSQVFLDLISLNSKARLSL